MPNKVLEDQKRIFIAWGHMEDFEKELKVCFLDEAQQSASAVESCFLDLEKSDNNDKNLNQIWDKKVELPYQDQLFEIEGYQIDNQGNVHLLGILFNEKKKEYQKSLDEMTEEELLALLNQSHSP